MRTTVLCVDDEPNVLEGLSLHLLRKYHVLTATSAEQALACLADQPRVSVIVSDLRMPEMDGAEFFGRARELAPDAVRVLLTGHADVDSAMRAINEGHVFKVLTKPCPPGQLMNTVAAAEYEHQLVMSERQLLDQTMAGAIRALTDALAHTHPASYRRASLLKKLVGELAQQLSVEPRWPLEVAAQASQLGYLAISAELLDRLYRGVEVTEAEREQLARAPAVADQMLSRIPRLEAVRALLTESRRPFRRQPLDPPAHRGAQILRVALDFEALLGTGDHVALAVDTLRSRDQYDPAVLDALEAVRGRGNGFEIRLLKVTALKPGMILADDVKLSNGTLLVTRGYEVTPSFLERATQMRAGAVREPLRVIVRRHQREVA
jgi:CheY-like chemotaxis protein